MSVATTTDPTHVLIESLDFDPACQYKDPRYHGPTPPRADWVVFPKDPLPCGCLPVQSTVLICTLCKQGFEQCILMRCATCGYYVDNWACTVERIEPLR